MKDAGLSPYRLTPLGLRAGVPFCITLMAGTIYLSDEERRTTIIQAVADARASIEERPESVATIVYVHGKLEAWRSFIRICLSRLNWRM